MTQLIVNIEDVSLVEELKAAIKLLKGIGSVTERNESNITDYNETTLQAMEEAKAGDTIKCNSFEEYLELVKWIQLRGNPSIPQGLKISP